MLPLPENNTMHRRSVSAEYHHLDTHQQQLDHRGSFSSSMNAASSPQYDATQNQPNLINQHHQVLPPPPPNTTQKPAHTNTFVHKLYK